MDCLKCGKEVPMQEGAGRPRKFCSEVCQKAAALEIKRVDALLAKMERDRATWSAKGLIGYARGAVVEIENLEKRLRQLLAAGDECTTTNLKGHE